VRELDINRREPAIAEGSIQIEAPPETVWEVLTDIEGWPSWNSEVKTAKLHGSLAERSMFKWKSGAVSITSVIRSFDPPREVRWTGAVLGVRAIHIYRFEPLHGETGRGPRNRGKASWPACSGGTVASSCALGSSATWEP
jgi:uncharacterized membrane protein